MSERGERLVAICYDVASHAARRRIARILLDHGERVQRSVFEAWLTPAAAQALRKRLERYIDPASDAILFVPLRGDDARRIEVRGGPPALGQAGFRLV